MPVAMKQCNSLYYLHHDHLGSLVSITDTTQTEQFSARYWPFGALRTSSGSFLSDRLFTGQTRDAVTTTPTDALNDAFYFFKARYYDAVIGKFHTPDTLVPDPANPQALNRYAYALNNPLRLVDPSGHASTVGGNDAAAPWDPTWYAQFIGQHHTAPGLSDWLAYKYSLSHPGTGPGGSWTDADWAAFRPVWYGSEFSFVRSNVPFGSSVYLGERGEAMELFGSPIKGWPNLVQLIPRFYEVPPISWTGRG
jgi:RHS repeat-associated protein